MTKKEYFSLLKRIVRGAEYLENPLIKREDYIKAMKLYDSLCEEVKKYQRGDLDGRRDSEENDS